MSADSIKAVAPVASSTFEGRTGVEAREGVSTKSEETKAVSDDERQAVEPAREPEIPRDTGPPKRPSTEEVAQRIQERLAEAQSKGYLRELRFHYESREDGVFQLKVIDAKTDKVLRTIPHEEQIEFAERLDNFLGLLIDEQA